MATEKSKIIYTLTDEAPLLATCAFLPIIRTFAAPADIEIVKSDISVAARILAEFPEYLTEAQRVPNNLSELGRMTLQPDTNIIRFLSFQKIQKQKKKKKFVVAIQDV